MVQTDMVDGVWKREKKGKEQPGRTGAREEERQLKSAKREWISFKNGEN